MCIRKHSTNASWMYTQHEESLFMFIIIISIPPFSSHSLFFIIYDDFQIKNKKIVMYSRIFCCTYLVYLESSSSLWSIGRTQIYGYKHWNHQHTTSMLWEHHLSTLNFALNMCLTNINNIPINNKRDHYVARTCCS